VAREEPWWRESSVGGARWRRLGTPGDHGALAGGRDGGEESWRQDGSMGFAGRVEVAPAADEVEGILHRGSARGLCGGDRRRCLVGKTETRRIRLERRRKKKKRHGVHTRASTMRGIERQRIRRLRCVDPRGKAIIFLSPARSRSTCSAWMGQRGSTESTRGTMAKRRENIMCAH
jgi:hypothetical protein